MQRHALGLLFATLAALLAATALWAAIGAGGDVRRWVVAFAAFALAGWLASLALSAIRHHR